MLGDEIALYAHQIQNGNITALSKLYEITYNRIYFIIFQIVKNREDAQDILQETYIRAFSNIQTLKDPACFYSRIIKISVNLSKNYIKHSKSILIENETDTFFDSITDDTQLSLTEHAENGETRDIVFKIIDLLPSEQKRAVLFFYYEHMTAAEIAEIEETSVSTITGRLSYARLSLKKAISTYARKNNIRLQPGGFALSIYSVIASSGTHNLLSVTSATDVFMNVINALGLSSVMSDGVKYISNITHYENDAAGFFEKAKRFIRTRLLFEVNPIYAVIPIILIVLLVASGAVLKTAAEKRAASKPSETEVTIPVIAMKETVNDAIISVTVKSFSALKKAAQTGSADIIIMDGIIAADSLIAISSSITITGGEITRYNAETNTFYDGVLFKVVSLDDAGSILTLKDITIDGCCYDETTDTFIRKAGNMISVMSDTSLILENAVIKNNNATSENGSTITGKSPKLISLTGSAEIRNCRSESNGAAVSMWGGKLSVSDDCIISGNISTENGGAFALTSGGLLYINGGTFEHNKCLGNKGGAVYSENGCKIVIKGGVFNLNEAANGGGAIAALSDTYISMTDCTLNNNKSFQDGGAISIIGCHLYIGGNTKLISNECVRFGGAIFADESEITFDNGNISDNSAFVGGGMIIRINSVFTMNGGIISNNISGNDGGGILIDGQSIACNVIINGGEITGNTAESLGGAIRNLDSALTIKGGKIYNNFSDSGGGIIGDIYKEDEAHKDKVFIFISGGEIYGNTAKSKGGGIMTKRMKIILDGGAIFNNTADRGNDLFMYTGTQAELISGIIDINEISHERNCEITIGENLNK